MITFPILNAVAGAGWRDQPGRIALSVLGIAFGVALGVAVHLINASAAKRDATPLRFRRMLPPPDDTRSSVPFEFLEPISIVVMDIPSVTTSSGA